MTVETIYGNTITGTLVATLENTVIVEDAKGERHVVHKSDLGTHKRKRGSANPIGSFDLAACKRAGKRESLRKGKHY